MKPPPAPRLARQYWFTVSCAALLVLAPNLAAVAETLSMTNALVIERIGRAARSPVHTDAIEAKIVSGTWQPPVAGEQLDLPGGTTRTWRAVTANKDGWFSDGAFQGGYAFVPVVVTNACVMLLEAAGHNLVYVNGEPRAGDPYSAGYVHLPVALHIGTNSLLFSCARGRLKVTLTTPVAPVGLDLADPTLPDLVVGRNMDIWGAVVVVNASSEPQQQLRIRATVGTGPAVETLLPGIPPLSARKAGFRLRAKTPATGEKIALQLTLLDEAGGRRTTLQSMTNELRIRRPDQTQKRTFISDIDGSVQYWALNPAQPAGTNESTPALFLSTHGASVEAIGQADAYSPKSWGHLVAPTNRRPYGFDWEDWGRLDALEVLAQAQSELHPDPQRIYLTGHSMGGHGVWQLGALFPGRFAAIGASAGWISFASYGGGRSFTNPTPVEAMLQRAAAASDTLALETNYLQAGVYILHGADDDNVPVGQARTMAERLSRFHHDYQFHEQSGAGHWWDVSDEPGADCVDWAPMFDFFAHHVIPSDASVRQVNFTIVNPGVSASCHWLEVQQQLHPLQKSVANIRWDPGMRRFVGTTENVARLALSLGHIQPGKPLKVQVDGQTLESIPWPAAGKLWLECRDEKWQLAGQISPAQKNPKRYGPFKDAFRHRMLLVYGTAGTPEESSWAFAKARFDAESFWYRGNGSLDVIPDTAFNPRVEPERGVILYGNADSNRAWQGLLGDSPVQVRRGEIKVGAQALAGEDLACVFLRPRPGSDVACVAVVSGSGVSGMRLTDRLPYFLAGLAYPDCTVIGPEMLTDGSAGVRVAGFFGLDWSVDRGEFAWRDK
jgi:poly(3-hydroxybutyrate) depolymerase